MRYVDAIDLSGKVRTFDLFKMDDYGCFVDGHRLGFDTDLIFISSSDNKKYGVIKEYSCKDGTFEEMKEYYICTYGGDNSTIDEILLSDFELLKKFFEIETQKNPQYGYYSVKTKAL